MAKVLFDHCVTRLLAPLLPGHVVVTTRKMGWDRLANGALLTAAAKGGFHAFITVDKKIKRQQNLSNIPLPVIAIDSVGNSLELLAPYAPDVITMLAQRLEHKVYVIPRKP